MKTYTQITNIILSTLFIFIAVQNCSAQAQLVQTFIELNNGGSSWFGISVSGAGDVNNDTFDDVIVGAIGINRAYIYYGGAAMNNTPDIIMKGEGAGNWYGVSVARAGDLNKDGYSDVIVGAYGYNSYTGRAYIYYGGSSMDTTADLVMTGQGTNSYFGVSVSTAGDVNNDNFGDIIVGAYQYGGQTGRAYIYYGGVSMDTTADVIMTGQGTSNYFGYPVSNLGDVNNDGYDDVIVGAYGYNSNTGRAYIYYGSSSMNSTADKTLTGQGLNYYFGTFVSGSGDVNNDGYDDAIVGAYGYNSFTGRAYIYYGGSSMDTTADVIMTGKETNGYFGSFVANAGDVNNDNYSDVIVGANNDNSGTGRAYIYYGGGSMDTTADVIMTGEAAGDNFGAYVSGAGDINNDSYDDVIVGAFSYNNYTGRAYIYYGGASMDAGADITMTGEGTTNYFGFSVSGAGDVNNDGYNDVIVGAPYYNTYSGRAYIYYGGNAMNNIADVTMSGEGSSSYFGASVSGAGDVNNDGFDDVIVGAYNINRAYIYYGGSTMDSTADVTLTTIWGAQYGRSVSGAGDVNNDGFDDVIVGATNYSTFTGLAYIYYGGNPMNDVEDLTLTGLAINNYFGISVSDAGDVNNDGYDDVIVGAYRYNSTVGRAYIYYGGNPMDNVADKTLTGQSTNHYFGISVSGAGDVNNDTYDDVIVGAYRYNSNTGRAYIYYGGSSMDTTADVTMTGEGTDNYYGISVSGAGDVNNDTYDDVIVGAYRYNSNTGRAYIYYGGSSMNSTADVTMTGEGADNYFGYSVSGAGDVNNDGCADVIIGAYTYPLNGKAYIFSDPDAPIPVELNTFTAEASSGTVQLYWNTVTEVSNYGFEIERRNADGSAAQWFKVAFIPGSGSSNSPKEYSFTDTKLSAGRYVYRLKQIDKNGVFKYSQSLEVEVGGSPKLFILNQNYPNPFNPSTTIEFTLAQDGKATLRVFDIIGREVATLLDEEMQAGVLHQVSFNASKLSSGIYFSCLESNGKKQVRKLILMK